MRRLESVIDRFERAREAGTGRYIACCPAHNDRTPSLALKECDDGRVLIHCFAGCDPESILDAVGLKFSDLMPERVGPAHSHKPQKWLNYRHALEALDHEALVVAVIGADFLKYRELDEETWSRLATAVERITATRAKLSPARSVR